MSLLETYDKNKKKHLLKEISVSGHASSFVGQKGDYVDRKFSGAFHPEMNDLKKTLEKQVDDDIKKRMYTDDVTPQADQDFIDLDWKYEYDEYIKQDNSKFKNTSETEMQLVDIEIQYDKIEDRTEEMKKFVSDTNDWKIIYNKR